jgi:hypothetical protein
MTRGIQAPPSITGLGPPPCVDRGPRTNRQAAGGAEVAAQVFAAALMAPTGLSAADRIVFAGDAVSIFIATLDAEVVKP